MTFSFDPNLGDVISRTRALLLDTREDGTSIPPLPFFSDEAIANYHALYGVDEGTAQLATILLNTYGNQPSQAVLPGGLSGTWGDRLKAWQAVIDNVRVYGIAGGTPPSRTPHLYRVRGRTPFDRHRRERG